MRSYAEIAEKCGCEVEDVRQCMSAARSYLYTTTWSDYTTHVEVTRFWKVPTAGTAGYAHVEAMSAYAGAIAETKTEAVEIALRKGWRAGRDNW